MCQLDATPPSPAQVRAARRAYMGSIAYVDAQLGRLRRALAAAGRDRDALVVLLSDHGEMLGERGLWYKMNFFEPSIRVPLVVHAPGRFRPRRVPEAVSLADLAPTLLEVAGLPPMPGPIEGRSLLPHLGGASGGHDEVAAEYTAEGALAPMVMIRRGPWKFVHSPADPDQLFDLSGDPGERVNLAWRPEFAPTVDGFRREVEARWDLAALDRAVRESQRRRRFVFAAGRAGGRRASWDFQPFADASERYIRSHMPLDALEASARFPRP
jgi:choline-sulfatase